MPLPVFKTKDEIPEAMRSGYIERDGQWVPDVEDVSGIKAAQRRALDEKKQLEEQLRAALGDRKLEDVADLLKKQKALEDEQARKAGDFDKLLEKRVNETKAEYEKRIAELAPYKQKYEDRELDVAIRDAAAKGGVIAEDMRLVIPIVKGSRIKLDEKSGKPVVYDVDGDPTGLTVEKFFAETFKAEAPKFYGASGGSGGGANGGSGGRPPGNGATISASDNAAFLANLDKIASGEVKVATP